MRGASGMDGAPKALLARALYNNAPDCFDELAFCKGDILTILEQHVPESEGWWRCLLHGRQGLAPANRLQILSEAPEDGPCPPLLTPLEKGLTSSKEAYQATTPLRPPPPGPVYESMKSWVVGPPPQTAQVYEFPDPPASTSARIVCEKVPSFPKQAVVPVPRPAQASLLALYDVPAQSRSPSALKEPGKQQLYDIPASPRKADRGPPAGRPSRQSAPVTATVPSRTACFKTLPNPQKPEWIYDIPASPAKAGVRNICAASVVEESGSLPRSMSGFHSPPSSRAQPLAPLLHGDVPMRNPSLPEAPAGPGPVPGDTCPPDGGVSYKVPSSFLVPRLEQQNTKPNIYDVPVAVPSGPRAGKELGDADRASEEASDPHCAWLSRQATWLAPETDRLSVNSSDSRASVMSSCSSTSTDSSCSSSSEETAKELSLDVALAKGTVTALQQKVASSVDSLMLFVSRNWRLRDSLEANIKAIRRAADLIEESLREFLDFARGVCRAPCHLPGSSLQDRMRDQLQTISDSYHILLEAKESLEGCHWSLDVLVTDRAQGSLDDLERFVSVARMVPEDIKRFTSIVIANGRLLFKQNCEKEDTPSWALRKEFKLAEGTQLPLREMESHQRSAPCPQQREGRPCRASVCEKKLPNLEEKVKPIREQKLDENKDLETQDPSAPGPLPPGQQDPGEKARLSEHCRLYFGALFKAVGVFRDSLLHAQPPETLVAQSKLVITIGQKLVDTLCRETQDRDARNEILRGSSRLCGLLKALALATKRAVLPRPGPAALQGLRAAAQELEQHARQFRGSLD
ncbi:cas scaffolding protein family member 4 isoform X2 [Pipistrellus kuhlii]|uniref:Cas scaffolding protein family member 4 n=2 Tax=Pipistrellus kuhlii TaxID=59472 RepID=A0A7J7Y7Y8_PIPKU|nr:cas scaffolding protein family member 4 [Pipistrellus kuhlii]XP_045430505.1 cas scaffolding protein family member 4 isoform X2 [Pipistrellus kuhlii]KAF6357944.1 Cas scaffold protein family member 4 [Pipistrellus kuhlii]